MSMAVDPARATAARIAEIVKTNRAAASTDDDAPDTRALQAWKYAPARMRPAGTVARRTKAATEVHGFVAGRMRAMLKNTRNRPTPVRALPDPDIAISIATSWRGVLIVPTAPSDVAYDKANPSAPSPIPMKASRMPRKIRDCGRPVTTERIAERGWGVSSGDPEFTKFLPRSAVMNQRRKMAPRAVGEMTIRPTRWAMPWAKNTPTARARKLIRRAVTWIARKSPRGNAPMRKKPPNSPRKRIVESMAETIRLEANFAIVMSLMSTGYRMIERIVPRCTSP